MIYANEPSNDHLEFENLLQLAKGLTLTKLSADANPSSISGAAFEQIVYEATAEVAVGTSFEGKIERTEDRAFPDIVAAGFFGIEVKATKKDDWRSIGNSVLESSRWSSVEKIYMFFGKLGGTPDIMYRNYEACLKGVSVTHYPRYQIDMKLAEGESIFAKMDVEYVNLRKSDNPVKPIRAYYASRLKKGQALWWIDDDIDETATTSPIIKKLSSLTKVEKDDIKAAVFAYFPEVFSNSTKKFERVAAYLVSAHSVLSPNLRDFFTAGGQVVVNNDGNDIAVPQILGEAIRLSDKVFSILAEKNETELSEAWGKPIGNFETPAKAWLDELDSKTSELSLSLPASFLFGVKIKPGE